MLLFALENFIIFFRVDTRRDDELFTLTVQPAASADEVHDSFT